MKEKNSLSARIRELRKSRGLSQAELATATGLSMSAIRSYENELREPNSKAMAALESYFHVTGQYLRGEPSKNYTDNGGKGTMEKREFEDLIGQSVSETDYEVIEMVYQWHPSVKETSGKEEVAELYKSFGLTIFLDMFPRAVKSCDLEKELRHAQAEVEAIKERMKELFYEPTEYLLKKQGEIADCVVAEALEKTKRLGEIAGKNLRPSEQLLSGKDALKAVMERAEEMGSVTHQTNI